MIKFAIPSVTSRLHNGSAQILGIEPLKRGDPLVMTNGALTLYQFRGTDIPRIVESGWVDCGLCGIDAVDETRADVAVLRRFPETTTRIALIGKAGATLQPRADGPIVATEFPEITRAALSARYPDLQTWKAHGSCESFAFIDAVDGVVDLVDTGETLDRNGLTVLEVLYETCICLIARRALSDSIEIDALRVDVRALLGTNS